MQQPTTTEDSMNNLTGPAYGSPGAKALIKELKEKEDALSVQLLDRSPAGIWQCDKEAAGRMADQWRALRNRRLALSTCPLPCKPIELPAKNYTDQAAAKLPDAPDDTSLYVAGDGIVVYSRGMWRQAVVVEAKRTQVEVAYTTKGSLDEMGRYGRKEPNVTRKVVPTKYLLAHQPRAAAPVVELHTQPPAGTVTKASKQEAPMADEATTEAPKRRGGRKRLEPFADPKAIMAANVAAYRAYETAQIKKDTPDRDAILAANRDGHKLYWRAYNQDLEARRATGDLKRKPKAKEAAAA